MSTDRRRLVYDRPAGNVNEALPLGNGRIGALVYGRPDLDRLSLNDDRLWAGTTAPPPRADGPQTLATARQLYRQGRRREAQTVLEEGLTTPFNQPYQPAGTAWFDWACSAPDPSALQGYERDLDLSTATAHVKVTRAGVTARHEFLVSAPAQVVMARFEAHGGPLPDLTIRLDSLLRHTVSADGNTLRLHGRTPVDVRWDGIDDLATPDNAVTYDDVESRHYAVSLRVTDTDGVLTSADGQLHVRGATRVVVLVALATDARDGAPAEVATADLDAAARHTPAQLRAAHVRDHAALFDRMRLRLPTPADVAATTDQRLRDHHAGRPDHDLLALMADYGRYLLIASSRPGTMPANLQGVWNESLTPPWWDNYTLNINLQMNYWPAHVTGLHECAEPLADFVHALSVPGRETAAVQYGARGWVANHQSDYRLQTTPVGHLRQGIPENAAKWALWPFGGAWLSLHLFERFGYTGDREALARDYPVMRGAAQFLLDWLVPDPDDPSMLTTMPSTSPENTYVYAGDVIAVSHGSTMDIAITRALFEACLAASAQLDGQVKPDGQVEPDGPVDADGQVESGGQDGAFVAAIREALARLPETRLSPDGRILELDADWPEGEHPHRHISHLFDLCPGQRISVESTPELAAAAARTLEFRGDDGTGWSLAWKARCWARLKDADHALRVLYLLLAPVDSAVVDWGNEGGGTYPNLLMCCPPFMIEANFGYVAALLELFVQDHTGVIDLLPAVPAVLGEGSLSGVCLRDGLVLSMRWSQGRVRELTLTTPSPRQVEMRLGGQRRTVQLSAGENVLDALVASSQPPT